MALGAVKSNGLSSLGLKGLILRAETAKLRPTGDKAELLILVHHANKPQHVGMIQTAQYRYLHQPDTSTQTFIHITSRTATRRADSFSVSLHNNVHIIIQFL